MAKKTKKFPEEIVVIVDMYDMGNSELYAYATADEAFGEVELNETVGVYKLVKTAKVVRKVELKDVPAPKAKGK